MVGRINLLDYLSDKNLKISNRDEKSKDIGSDLLDDFIIYIYIQYLKENDLILTPEQIDAVSKLDRIFKKQGLHDMFVSEYYQNFKDTYKKATEELMESDTNIIEEELMYEIMQLYELNDKHTKQGSQRKIQNGELIKHIQAKIEKGLDNIIDDKDFDKDDEKNDYLNKDATIFSTKAENIYKKHKDDNYLKKIIEVLKDFKNKSKTMKLSGGLLSKIGSLMKKDNNDDNDNKNLKNLLNVLFAIRNNNGAEIDDTFKDILKNMALQEGKKNGGQLGGDTSSKTLTELKAINKMYNTLKLNIDNLGKFITVYNGISQDTTLSTIQKDAKKFNAATPLSTLNRYDKTLESLKEKCISLDNNIKNIQDNITGVLVQLTKEIERIYNGISFFDVDENIKDTIRELYKVLSKDIGQTVSNEFQQYRAKILGTKSDIHTTLDLVKKQYTDNKEYEASKADLEKTRASSLAKNLQTNQKVENTVSNKITELIKKREEVYNELYDLEIEGKKPEESINEDGNYDNSTPFPTTERRNIFADAYSAPRRTRDIKMTEEQIKQKIENKKIELAGINKELENLGIDKKLLDTPKRKTNPKQKHNEKNENDENYEEHDDNDDDSNDKNKAKESSKKTTTPLPNTQSQSIDMINNELPALINMYKIFTKLNNDIEIYIEESMNQNVNEVITQSNNNEDSIFNSIWNEYQGNLRGARKDDIAIKADEKLYERIRMNDLDPSKVLKVNIEDKVIFAILLYFMRFIIIIFIELLIDYNVIKTINSALGAFIFLFIILFFATILVINYDSYKLRILINYLNLHTNSTKVYFMFMLTVLFYIIVYVIINANQNAIEDVGNFLDFTHIYKHIYNFVEDKLPNDKDFYNDLTDQEKLKLQYRLEVITMIVYIFSAFIVIIM